MSCIYEWLCGNPPWEEEDLKSISSEVALRSQLGQLESLSKDKTHERVYNILKHLVKERRYMVPQLETLCIGLNIWLYSVPVAPGYVSINPGTKFQCRRVLRVFLGTSNDWFNNFKKNASPDVSYSLEDTAFEEKE
jgi:hypothetical protein